MSNDFIHIGKAKIAVAEYASQGNAILGIRDSGKTYTATMVAEQLIDAGIPFIAFDPIGVWKFLRVPGKGEAYPIVVAGGRNGDLPIDAKSAPQIVRAAMRENIPLVIDLYDINLSKADWKQIVEQCVRLLLYENGDYGLRHLFIEEAAEFVPQKIGPDQGRVYAEMEKLARMGGNAQLGYTLINQRAEEVNKAVLELCDCLLLHRQKGRNSITALSKWLDIADVDDAEDIIKSMTKLERGECWVWAGGTDTPVRVRVQEKNTAHPDRRALTVSKGASFDALDVSAFVSRLAGTLEQLKTEKPKRSEPSVHLGDVQGTVRDLEKRIEELTTALDEEKARHEQELVEQIAATEKFTREHSALSQAIRNAVQILQAALGGGEFPTSGAAMPLSIAPTYAPLSVVKRIEQQVEENPRVTGVGKRIFGVLAREYPDFPNGLPKVKLAMYCKVKPDGGRWNGELRDLVSRRYIVMNGTGNNAIVAINPDLLK